MASSQNKCFVRYEAGAYPIGNSPTDAALMRDAFAENACHLADEMTQPRVQWSPKTGEYLTAGTTTLRRVKVVGFGPFPITMRPDGSSSRLVVRISAMVNSAITTSAQTMYAFLGSGSSWSGPVPSSATQGYSVSNTSAAWLTPSIGSQYVYLDPAYSASLLGPVPSPGATSGANVALANIYMATLTLVAVQTDANAIQVHAVSAREYIGT